MCVCMCGRLPFDQLWSEGKHDFGLLTHVIVLFPLWYCMVLTPTLQHIPNLVVDIKTMGNRVYVSDVQESIHYLRYRPTENQLVIFSDDTYQR